MRKVAEGMYCGHNRFPRKNKETGEQIGEYLQVALRTPCSTGSGEAGGEVPEVYWIGQEYQGPVLEALKGIGFGQVCKVAMVQVGRRENIVSIAPVSK
jgi:hypothetical protein